MLYLYAFIISLVIVVVLIPPLRRFALKIDFVDKPRTDSARKIHREPIPLTAGIAIFVAFMVAFLLLDGPRDWNKTAAIVLGGVLILGIGIVDDWFKTSGREFPALPKFIVQLAAAVPIYFSGIVFEGFGNPFTGEFIWLPPWLSFIFTVVWIFGVTTVINFTDGMDGLAGGITAISGGTLFVIALVMGQTHSAIMAIIIVGVSIGYLFYNKPPAKVFMGDAGATFLGFMLGVIALEGAFKQATVFTLIVPVLALGLPILDNLRVVIVRMIKGVPIYKADATQMHYKLLHSGLKPVQVVSFMYLVNLCLGLFSIIILLTSSGF